MLEASIGGAGSEDLAKLVEANLFANVELDQDQDRAGQESVWRLGGYQSGEGLGWHLAYGRGGDGGFTIHNFCAQEFVG